MKVLDRVLSFLLILGGCGHTADTIIGYKDRPEWMLWSPTASCFIFMLGAVNLVRAARVGDGPLGWICLVFNLCWLLGGVQFGRLIGNMADPRVIGFAVIATGLCWMSVRTIVARTR